MIILLVAISVLKIQSTDFRLPVSLPSQSQLRTTQWISVTMSVLKIQSLDLHLPVSALAVDVVDDFVVCGDVELARNLQP